MIASQLYDLGFEDLVSVIPPGAMISSNSNIDESQRGKVPGKKGSSGWYGYAFTKERVDPANIDKWEANVGLLGNRFPALDIDCDHEPLAKAVTRVALQTLGSAPVRLSREPRRLLVYRTEAEFARIALIVTYEGQSHLIEFLGRGRQYLVAGKHPSGVDYGWQGPALWECAAEDLTLIDRDMALAFLNNLKEELESRGLECELVGDGKAAAEKAPPQEDLLAPSQEALEAVVDKIPNDQASSPDREHYLQVGYAIKAAAAAMPDVVGRGLFTRWAGKREPDDRVEGNPETWARDWQRMQPPYRVGWSWLQEQAEAAGEYVSAVDEFEADPDAALPPVEENSSTPETGNSDGKIELSDAWVTKYALGEIGDGVRFVPVSKDWHVWNGHAWELDQLNMIFTLVGRVLLKLSTLLLERSDVAPTKAEAQQYRTKAKALQSREKLESIVRLLQYEPSITCMPTAFDANPWLLNTPAGMFDLLKREQLDNDPRAMCARSAGVPPVSGVAHRWQQFLDEATDGDEELQLYLQKLVGYALTGDVSEQILPFVWGRSNTGKSVFVKTIAAVLGTYAEPAPLDTFISSRNDRVPADLAALAGARLVTSVETQAGRSWDEQRVKALTAGDSMKVRHLYGRFFNFAPSFKILIAGNHEPTIKNLDDAMRRRLHVVPLDRVVPVEDRDRGLLQTLEAEHPQILAWAIAGCFKWQEHGLEPPESVILRTEKYIDEEDEIGQWLRECCDIDPEHESSRSALYRSWQQWSHEMGNDPGGAKQFKRKLDPKGFKDKLIGRERLRGYRGLRVKPAIEDGTNGDFDA
jgi:P4 family phage/plasmid primase-like protien